ncbi:malate synthase A [Sphingobacteriaceae bacterium WQ 2009]|uniref:malate synthase n=1 Tax=Rhinopithecimicrobium faecis TaxID=2820698 RepID=A0A8T4HAL6_9SPHI|nr:malate synthase A [Sphingobacteriaceae bacterium WQ 2009]
MSLGLKELQIDATPNAHASKILSPDVLQFLLTLHKEFNERRLFLLRERERQQQDFNRGVFPKFKTVAAKSWKVTAIPLDLQQRTVEITGPADRKMIINALNSEANTFMVDLEDSLSPTWHNVLQGQQNIFDAVRGKIDYEENGKSYRLKEETAVLIVRPRGLHLQESHVLIGEDEIAASLFDFGIFFFKNAKHLLSKGTGPYLYLPKLEDAAEAAWWAEVFHFSERHIGLPPESIKATVLAETITASFQLAPIIFELRNYIVGINCGRWDYIFSYIKKFHSQEDCMLPDRNTVLMSSPFMEAYTSLVIQTCHRHGILAIGGMAAQIPIKGDDARNDIAFEKVRLDKVREVQAGHDGTWVAHPAMVAVAREAFESYMTTANQLQKPISNRVITEHELLQANLGEVTAAGVMDNIHLSITYLSRWLKGQGAVAINHLMEDAATVEIARAQLWQWRRNHVFMADGQRLTAQHYKELKEQVLQKIPAVDLLDTHTNTAIALLEELVTAREFIPFAISLAYKKLTDEKFN